MAEKDRRIRLRKLSSRAFTVFLKKRIQNWKPIGDYTATPKTIKNKGTK